MTSSGSAVPSGIRTSVSNRTCRVPAPLARSSWKNRRVAGNAAPSATTVAIGMAVATALATLAAMLFPFSTTTPLSQKFATGAVKPRER